MVSDFLIQAGMTVRFAHDGKSGLRSALTGLHDCKALVRSLLTELLQLRDNIREDPCVLTL